jgi:ABC-type antimicrobial peptide transport system permease subunit
MMLLGVLVAIVSSVAMAAATGASRTASSLDRLLAASDASDVEMFVFTADVATELGRSLATVDGVAAIGLGHAFLAGVPTTVDFAIVSSPDGSLMNRIGRPRLLRGRMPEATVDDEIVLNELAASDLGLDVGDHLIAPMGAPDLFDFLATGGPFPGFNGPRFELEVVGIIRMPDDLLGDKTSAGPFALASPAFDRAVAGRVAVSTIVTVSIDDPAAIDDVRAIAQSYAQSYPTDITTSDQKYADVQAAIDVLFIGLIVFAIVATIAGLVSVGQTIKRQVAASADAASIGRALGLTSNEQAWSIAAAPLIGTVVGALFGAVLAVLASPFFPLSVAGRAEPNPGVSLNLAVLAVGVLTAGVGFGSWGFYTARREVDHRPSKSQPASSALSRVARSAPVVQIGLSRALRPAGQSSAARAALLGAGFAVAGVAAGLVVGSTLDDAIATPERWGWTWSTRPDVNDEALLDQALAELAVDPNIVAMARLDRGNVILAGQQIYAFAIEARHGSLTIALADGRLPVSASEVALGAGTMQDLNAEIGEIVRATDPTGVELALLVVGEVALPVIDNAVPGDGAAFTTDGLVLLATDPPEQSLLLHYADDADRTALHRRLLDDYQIDADIVYARPHPPQRLTNLHEVVSLLPALSVFLGTIGLLGLLHTLVVSARSGRREFGVLSALGLRRSQLRGVVISQAAVIVAAGLVVGVPIGVAAGRLIWSAMVAEVGMLGGSSTPWVEIGAVAALSLAIAVAVAVAIGQQFAHVRPAENLRAE